jgi:hypothetical protein
LSLLFNKQYGFEISRTETDFVLFTYYKAITIRRQPVLRQTSPIEKIRNFILFSPFVLEAEIESPDNIRCRLGAFPDFMSLEIDQDGVVRLVNRNPGWHMNLALGPSEDLRSVARSLDYFMSGMEMLVPRSQYV